TAQLAWISVADGTFRVLRSLDWRRPGRPKLSPDGRYIAYSALKNQDSEDSHIYVLAADGSSEKEIVTRSGANEAPVWTLDGSRILFTSYRSGTYDLWSVALSGSGRGGDPSLIQPDIGKILPIGLTRSGSFYYVHERGAENVFLANLKEGRVEAPLVRLTESFAGSNRGPAWSPDGKFIAFKRRGEGNRIGYDLVVHALDTGAEQIYSSNTLAGVPAKPLWLHDGTGLVLAMADRQERISFHRLNLKTGQFTEVLAPDTSYLSLAALSPDDHTLYLKNSDGVASYNLRTGDYGQVVS